MANEPYSITNQKLYFAKLTLTNWQSLESSPEFNKALLKAQQEVTIFHLYSALWAIYNEIASFYRFPLLNEPSSLTHWLTKAFVEQYPSPELNELALLLVAPDSAVASVNSAWLELFNTTKPTQQQATNLIATEQLDSSLTREALEANLQQLTDLIRRFRAGLTEY